jgi:hypothetical protein
MQINLADESLFGNDAGEDEIESVLMSYFVDREEFKTFLNPAKPIHIAKGRKGMGKSALLVRFAHDLRHATTDPKPVVVHLVAADLVALRKPPDTENPHVLQNYWQQVICGAINMELAREIGFAWKDDQIALVETAELTGFKGRNLFGALISRIIGKINLGAVELASRPLEIVNHEQLLSRVSQQAALPRAVYFLLDDIDTQYQNTPAQQLYISTFFSACRNLAVNNISQLHIRATVRSDVWASNRSAENLDIFEQYLTDITWSANQQKSILTNRVFAYIKRNDPTGKIASTWNVGNNADDLLNLVFVKQMKWGPNNYAPSSHVVRILAGGRPRWIAQLCRMAGERAAKEGRDRIARNHVMDCMALFGERRLADLYKEHQYQFSDLRALIESFAAGPRSFTTAALLQRLSDRYIGHSAAKGIPRIDGVDYFDSLQIARFLFKCGFINGHNEDYQNLGVSEFVTYEERPDLLSVSTNLDDGMTWEVQPAYRNVLKINA